jgi:hypothetical protein
MCLLVLQAPIRAMWSGLAGSDGSEESPCGLDERPGLLGAGWP